MTFSNKPRMSCHCINQVFVESTEVSKQLETIPSVLNHQIIVGTIASKSATRDFKVRSLFLRAILFLRKHFFHSFLAFLSFSLYFSVVCSLFSLLICFCCISAFEWFSFGKKFGEGEKERLAKRKRDEAMKMKEKKRKKERGYVEEIVLVK